MEKVWGAVLGAVLATTGLVAIAMAQTPVPVVAVTASPTAVRRSGWPPCTRA